MNTEERSTTSTSVSAVHHAVMAAFRSAEPPTIGEARIVVPGALVGELKHVKHRYAKAALALARKYEIIPTEYSGDDAVVEVAFKTGGYVLTNDKELRRRLRKEGVPIIFLRSSTHLAIDTYLGEE